MNIFDKKTKIMVSGIQPSNKLTIGNYLGAIKQFVKLQNDYKMFIFVADLHAITNTFDPKTLANNKKDIIAFYYACGLNFKQNIIFYQSDVTAHCNLGHILLCHTYLGELNRMTQFKDKSKKQCNNESIPAGLLTYPTLMAADILLYDSDVVIVGKDQKQHLELTRDLAIRMNNKYGKIFVVPEPLIVKQGQKIMDLQDPSIKMSKSNKNEKGIIYLLDDLDVIKTKIMKAKTDMLNCVKYDEVNQPGISNLINIYVSFSNYTIEDIEKKYCNITNYAEFKKDLAAIVVENVDKIQKQYRYALNNFTKLNETLIKNAKLCNDIASKKLQEIYQKIGLKE